MATKNTKKRTAKKAAVTRMNQKVARGKAARKTPRKMYAYVRKDQKGTPMEDMINGRKESLEESNVKRKREMKHTEVPKGSDFKKLKNAWTKNYNTGTKARSIRKYMDKNNVGRRIAKRNVNRIHVVSFGADPKNK